MAEVQGNVRAVVGKSHVDTSADIKVTTVAIGIAVILAACVIAWAAEGMTPRKLFWQYDLTEREASSQDFHDHLATAAELLQRPVFVPVVYPGRTAPGITATMHQGFRTSTWQTGDPEIGRRPTVEPW